MIGNWAGSGGYVCLVDRIQYCLQFGNVTRVLVFCIGPESMSYNIIFI